MVDFANLVNWVFSLVVFLYPAIMFPLQWFDDALIDFLNAWYYVNLLADLIPFYYIAFFVMNIIIMATAGQGNQRICDISGNCVFNNSYYSVGDAVASWLIWFILDAASYFTLFYFGGDAMRYLLPDGGYDLKYLYPQLIYELLVITGVSEDHSNELDWEHIPGEIQKREEERKAAQEALANGEDPNADTGDAEDIVADI